MLFNSLSEKHNKATARHHLESIPPKPLQIFPTVILLHVPSITLWIKDGHAACSGIQLNHQPWGCDPQTERKLLWSPLQLLWLSSGFCVGEAKKCKIIPSALLEDPLKPSQTWSCWPNNLLAHGSCSSFFISITQYPGSPKPKPGRTKAQTALQCLVRGRFNTSHVCYPSLTASHNVTSQAGRVKGNKITQKTSLK